MFQGSIRDLAGGLIFIAFGLAFAGTAYTYDLGSAVRMGPGYFPLVLGGLLTLLGAGVIVEGIVKSENVPLGGVPWRALVLLIAALIVFGYTVRRAGLAPALFAAVFLAALSSAKTGIVRAAIMAAGLTIFCILIFVEGLGLPVPLIGPWLRF